MHLCHNQFRRRYDDLLARLKRTLRSGHSFIALCLAHDDRHHSLSLLQGSDRILIKCHASCDYCDICAVLGIEQTPWGNNPRHALELSTLTSYCASDQPAQVEWMRGAGNLTETT
jgi:hypothetical protein